MRGGDLRERDEVGGVGERVGRVLQRRCDAESALVHRLGDQRAHLVELVGRRLARVEADDVLAQRARADERCDVGRDPARGEPVEVAAEGRPPDLVLDVLLPVARALVHVVAERPHRALAEHLERDALAQLALRAAVLDQRLLRVRQHVDEAGRDREPGRIDLALAVRVAEVAHGRDPVAVDRDVPDPRRRPGAVDEQAVADDHVVGRRAAPGSVRAPAAAITAGDGTMALTGRHRAYLPQPA